MCEPIVDAVEKDVGVDLVALAGRSYPGLGQRAGRVRPRPFGDEEHAVTGVVARGDALTRQRRTKAGDAGPVTERNGEGAREVVASVRREVKRRGLT
jgi:hypothetical protein